jgi:ABC-type sugar transport system permease subunit
LIFALIHNTADLLSLFSFSLYLIYCLTFVLDFIDYMILQKQKSSWGLGKPHMKILARTAKFIGKILTAFKNTIHISLFHTPFSLSLSLSISLSFALSLSAGGQ